MPYQVITSGPFATNGYLLYANEKEAVIIDPAPGSAPQFIEWIDRLKLTPQAIWLTHSHWDHFADAPLLKKKYGLAVFVDPEDAGNIEVPGTDGLPCWIQIEGVTPKLFTKNQNLNVGNLKVQIIQTPGHTPGGLCFYLPEQSLLFSGDTLFQGTIGNLSFPTARPALMWKSLAELAKLPSNTIVLPGHGPATTIGKEHWLGKAEDLFG